MSTQIQLRRDTAADWTSNNPTLAAGEVGYESDTGLIKIGDGSTAWTSLGYTYGLTESIWMPASSFSAYTGSASIGILGSATSVLYQTDAFLFDASATEGIQSTFYVPANWSTIDIELWWSNAGAGSGDVYWQTQPLTLADTDTSDAAGSTTSTAVTAPAQYVVSVDTVGSGKTVTAGEMGRLLVLRSGPNGSDTLANDAGLIGVRIVRAS